MFSEKIKNLVESAVAELGQLSEKEPDLASFASHLQDIVRRGFTIAAISSSSEQATGFFYPVVTMALELLENHTVYHRLYKKDCTHTLKELVLVFRTLEGTLRTDILGPTRNQ